MVANTQKKWRWQNLFHQKCPKCDARMQCNGKYFICPSSQNDPAKEVEHPNCFVIKKQVAIEMLTNPRHSANIFLSSHERESLGEAIHSF